MDKLFFDACTSEGSLLGKAVIRSKDISLIIGHEFNTFVGTEILVSGEYGKKHSYFSIEKSEDLIARIMKKDNYLYSVDLDDQCSF